MGYPPEHKEETRARVIEAAKVLFRRYGYNGVGIDTIMAEAGLTRGGFYAHFRSKQDLFAVVLRERVGFTKQMLAHGDGTTEGALHVMDLYLDPDNYKDHGASCVMATLTSDVARMGGEAGGGYTESLREMLEVFAEQLGDGPERRRAMASAALCMGGISLARAVNDDEMATDILVACREALRRLDG